MPNVYTRDHEHYGHNGCHERRERLRETATCRRGKRPQGLSCQRSGYLRHESAAAAQLNVERVQLRCGCPQRRGWAEMAKEHQHPGKPLLLRVGRKPKPRFEGHPQISS